MSKLKWNSNWNGRKYTSQLKYICCRCEYYELFFPLDHPKALQQWSEEKD